MTFDDQSNWGSHAPQGWYRWLIGACHRLPAMPLMYRLVLLLRRPVKYGARTPLDVISWGLKLRLMPRGNIAEAKMLYSPQFFDRQEWKWLCNALPKGGTFLDIGANAGAYSFHVCAEFGPDTRVIAVEADPELQRRLLFNRRNNPSLQHLSICPTALSDHQGTIHFKVNENQRGQNQVVANAGPDSVEVPVTTLSALLEEQRIKRIDVMKIDIEGHELNVLEPFFASAPPHLKPRGILLEHEHDQGALNRLLQAQAYRLVEQNGRNQFMVLDTD